MTHVRLAACTALISGALALWGATDARAADAFEPSRFSAAPAPAFVPVWNGLYVGSSFGQAYTPGESDFLGGGLIGYNWQFGAGPVVGLEADVGVLNGSALSNMASVRIRGGYAMGRLLVFGTLGVVGATTRERLVLANRTTAPDVLSSQAQTRIGAIAGVGLEGFISNSMSLKGEYAYAHFGGYDVRSSLRGQVRLPLHANIFRVSLNYHFNGARQFDLSLREFQPYFGVSASRVHHTGRDDAHPVSTEKYVLGGKAFAGARLTDWAALELAYNYLGRAPVTRVGNVRGSESSSSIGASLVTFSDPLFAWWDWSRRMPEVRIFSRLGLAYKMSEERVAGLSSSADGVVFNPGLGLQLDFEKAFVRIEYEFLSRLHANSVISARHTPLSLSVGWKL